MRCPIHRAGSKKWWSGFKAVLVVYPVCGALFALSKMSQLIANTADGVHIWMIVVGILMTFLPLVAAPALIKKSLATFGTMGAVFSNLGSKVRSGIKSGEAAFQRTGAYEDATRTAAAKRLERKIHSREAVKNGTATRMDRLRNRFSGGERGYQRDKARLQRMRMEDTTTLAAAIQAEGATPEMMQKELSDLFDVAGTREGGLNASENERAAGLMATLASMPGGGKQIELAAKDRDGNIRKGVATILSQNIVNNENVSRAIGNRSALLASYIRDLNSGAIEEEELDDDGNVVRGISFDNYCRNMDNNYLNYRREEAIRAKREGRQANFMSQEDFMSRADDRGNPRVFRSVSQHVANTVLKKDKDLLAQSGTDLEKYLLPNIDNQSRIDNLESNNDYIFRSGEIDQETKDLIRSRRSETYVDASGREMRVRNISQGNVAEGVGPSYERFNSATNQWDTIDGNLSGYTAKAEFDSRQASVTGTTRMQSDELNSIINSANIAGPVDPDTGTMLNPASLGRFASLMTTMSSSADGREEIARALENVTGAAANMIGQMAIRNNAIKEAVMNSSNLAMQRLSSIASEAIPATISQADFNNLNADYVEYANRQAAAIAEARASGKPLPVLMNQDDWINAESSAGRTIDLTNTVQQAELNRVRRQNPSRVNSTRVLVDRSDPNRVIRVKDLEDGRTVNIDTNDEIDIRDYRHDG